MTASDGACFVAYRRTVEVRLYLALPKPTRYYLSGTAFTLQACILTLASNSQLIGIILSPVPLACSHSASLGKNLLDSAMRSWSGRDEQVNTIGNGAVAGRGGGTML